MQIILIEQIYTVWVA